MRFTFGAMMSMVFCLFGCSPNYQIPDYEKIADRITEKTAKKLQQQKKLRLVGTGGKMMHDIQAMHMGFYYYQEVDLQTARELIIYAIDEYLSEINNSKEIRPYLHEYPFTAKNVEINIWIFKPDRTHPPLDKIYCISARNGTLHYYLDLPETYSELCICEETYEEAKSKCILFSPDSQKNPDAACSTSTGGMGSSHRYP